MKQPLVTVKMITYNHAPLIARAIEGVLQQRTTFPFELVIGEDCSTDGTREIVFAYQKKHPDVIRVVTSKNNVGMAQNSRRTCRACRGTYLAFCEGDDHWHASDKLQKQADYLERHPECGLVYSSYDVYHASTGQRIRDFIRHRKWEVAQDAGITEVVSGESRPLTCTVMVRRELAERVIKADPYLHQSVHFLMGDTQLWAEIAAEAPLHFMPESLATYTITEESATRSRDIRKALRFARSGAELLVYLCRKHNLAPGLRKHCEEHLQAVSLRLAFHERSRTMAQAARTGNKRLTLQEHLLYLGAGNGMVHYPVLLAVLLKGLFRKKHSQWH